MPTIHVCALSAVDKNLADLNATHLMSVIGHKFEFQRPASIDPENFLRVKISDIVPDDTGLILPEHQSDGHILAQDLHIQSIIDFAKKWDRQAPMLIHCYAGVSRSTAAAYISMLAINPELDDYELAAHLRQISPTATPNPHIIAIADKILVRNGRMIMAVQAMGRGADCFEGVEFMFETKH